MFTANVCLLLQLGSVAEPPGPRQAQQGRATTRRTTRPGPAKPAWGQACPPEGGTQPARASGSWARPRVLAVPRSGCVTLGKSVSLSEPLSPSAKWRSSGWLPRSLTARVTRPHHSNLPACCLVQARPINTHFLLWQTPDLRWIGRECTFKAVGVDRTGQQDGPCGFLDSSEPPTLLSPAPGPHEHCPPTHHPP